MVAGLSKLRTIVLGMLIAVVGGLWPGAALVSQEPPRTLPPENTSVRPAIAALEVQTIGAIQRAEDSVVAIARVGRVAGEEGFQVPNLGRLRWNARLAESLPTDADYIPAAYGAGVIFDESGLIVTTYHVLGAVPNSDYFVWHRRQPYKAQVVAADGWMDLAVLKIIGSGFRPLSVGSDRPVVKGQFVLALGNPQAVARDGHASAAWGMVANIGRRAPPLRERGDDSGSRESVHQYGTLLQLDARLPLGFSGGAVLNLDGEMIGLTTAYTGHLTQPEAANLAIPVDDHFRRTLQKLKSGEVPDYGFLGVGLQTLEARARTGGRHGALVESVMEGTPAARAELRSGDVITHCEGIPLFDDDDLIREVSLRPAGDPVRLTIRRPGANPDRFESVELVPILTKRSAESLRPPVATSPASNWRGMAVEDATAAPRTALIAIQLPRHGGVYISHIEPESPAWRAGLRTGGFITAVVDQPITTGREFLQRVREAAGDGNNRVTMQVLSANGQSVVQTVSP